MTVLQAAHVLGFIDEKYFGEQDAWLTEFPPLPPLKASRMQEVVRLTITLWKEKYFYHIIVGYVHIRSRPFFLAHKLRRRTSLILQRKKKHSEMVATRYPQILPTPSPPVSFEGLILVIDHPSPRLSPCCI